LLQGRKDAKLLESTARSLTRVAGENAQLRETMAQPELRTNLERVVRPRSMAGGMKKAGIALLLSPDPVTDVAGIALLATAHVAKKREPTNVKHVVNEARKILRDIESLKF
jgi:hypothetical protein